MAARFFAALVLLRVYTLRGWVAFLVVSAAFLVSAFATFNCLSSFAATLKRRSLASSCFNPGFIFFTALPIFIRAASSVFREAVVVTVTAALSSVFAALNRPATAAFFAALAGILRMDLARSTKSCEAVSKELLLSCLMVGATTALGWCAGGCF